MTEQPYRPPTQAPPPQQAKRRKPKRWPWILGIVLAFGLGTAVGSAGKTAPASTGAAPITVTSVDGTSAPAAAPAPAAPAAPAGPKTEFGDGTYLVGTDIAVGSYKSNGPREGSIPNCYWARMKDDSGALGSILANNSSQGATRLTVKKGEYLQIIGCDWTKA